MYGTLHARRFPLAAGEIAVVLYSWLLAKDTEVLEIHYKSLVHA